MTRAEQLKNEWAEGRRDRWAVGGERWVAGRKVKPETCKGETERKMKAEWWWEAVQVWRRREWSDMGDRLGWRGWWSHRQMWLAMTSCCLYRRLAGDESAGRRKRELIGWKAKSGWHVTLWGAEFRGGCEYNAPPGSASFTVFPNILSYYTVYIVQCI